MKLIKYKFKTGEDESGEPILFDKQIECTATVLESNIAIAEKEAYGGEYSVEGDGTVDEPTEAEDNAAMLVDHEYRLTLLELGITE